jgi:phosphatidyl-myo-inositol dimannoside synthase
MTDRKRLRIALLVDVFLPHAGGSRVYYYNLFHRMAAHDDVQVLTTKIPGWEDFDAREETSSFTIKRRFKPLRDMSYLQLPKLAGTILHALSLTMTRPDVLHCGDLYPPGLIGVMLKRLVGLPFVAYCHGEDFTLTEARRHQPKIRNLIYRTADGVIANGAFAVDKLLAIGIPKERIFKITPGLDTDVFFPHPSDALRARYGLGDELVVMTVARVIPRKGHSRVIRAMAELGDAVPPFKYVIAGKGPYESTLRELAAAVGVQDKVIFAGYIPETELNLHHNLADVFVMPNIETDGGDIEGFGMVFLEANATGKPVIGGRSGGTAEAIVDGVTGYLVDEGDDEELVERLRRLLMDKELRNRMGDAGLRRVQTEFSWEPRAALLSSISADIAGSKKA